MPIHEYHCQKCGHRFDTRRSIINADKPTPCENYDSQETYTTSKPFFSHNKSGTKNPPVVAAAAVMAELALLTGINKK